jgi:hypothetical protein
MRAINTHGQGAGGRRPMVGNVARRMPERMLPTRRIPS